jgi:uncharacterized protein (DUF1697 family)
VNTYISILRGINLGGHNMIKMDALEEIFAKIGFKNVRTYIQSGNVVYQSQPSNPNKLNDLIHNTLAKEIGLNIPIITLISDELRKVAELNPFLEKYKEESYFHVTFLADAPLAENIDKILGGDFGQDEVRLIEKTAYLYCPNGYGRTKLSNSFFERKLKVAATTRNWKTVNQLLAIAAETENLK